MADTPDAIKAAHPSPSSAAPPTESPKPKGRKASEPKKGDTVLCRLALASSGATLVAPATIEKLDAKTGEAELSYFWNGSPRTVTLQRIDPKDARARNASGWFPSPDDEG